MFRNRRSSQVPLAAIVMLLVGLGPARAGVIPELATMQLSQIPTELTPLDPGGVLDGVRVYVCNKEPYGSFFLEVAMVHGTLVLADSLTTRFGRTLAQVANGEFEVPMSEPEKWPDLVERVAADGPDRVAVLQEEGARLEMLIGPLLSLGDRVPSLVARAGALTNAAHGDFPGVWGKLKLVRVMNGIRGSAVQLAAAGTSSVRTVNNVRAIIAAVQP